MKSRNIKRMISAVVALVMVLSILPMSAFARSAGDDGSAEMNEDYANRQSLAPIGASFNVNTLLEWTPESDPDAPYSRASIPLETRHGGFVVNPLANPEAKLMLCSLANSNHDHASTQGSTDFFSYAFNYWQYADSFVYWTGSEEGLIAIPTGDFIDAAHTNGVPIVSTLGFPWGGGSGYVEQVQKFVQKAPDGSFPVADKLIEVMDYYGFDGYFFNQESYGCSEAEGALIMEMMRYMHEKRPDMLISWYDSMLPSGNVSYQDAVNDSNKALMAPDENGVVPVDEFFMNYNWGGWKNTIDTTVNAMTSIGRSPYDAFAGFNVQANVYGDRLEDHLLLDEDGLMRISLALFCSNMSMMLAKDGEQFHETEMGYYVNSAGDPRENPVDAADPNVQDWAGLSRFFADKTPVTSLPFHTDFNTGHGKDFFVDGKASLGHAWSYQSLQDVLPTWTWIIDCAGEKLHAGYDFADAWNGGSSIAFTGSVKTGVPNNIMLYSTDILVEDTLRINAKVKGGDANLVLYYGDDSVTSYEDCQKLTTFSFPGSDPSTWRNLGITTNDLAGQHLYAIGLQIDPFYDAPDYKLNLGALTIDNGQDAAAAEAPTGLYVEDLLYRDSTAAEARVRWDAMEGAASYELYTVDAEGNEQFLMQTPNTAFYIPELSITEGQTQAEVRVYALNEAGERSGAAASVVIPWAYDYGDTDLNISKNFVNVALNAKVTAFSEQGDGAECDKALDGKSGDASKWWASNGYQWMSIDLGQPRTINRWRVEHAEAGGEGKDLNTADFALEYKGEDGQWHEVKRITGNTAAITDVLLDAPVTAQEWKLVVYRCGPSPWSAVNIYEWKMYEERELPSPRNISMKDVTVTNNAGAEDTVAFNNAPVGKSVRIYSQAGEVLAEEQIKNASMTVTLDLGAEAGMIRYSVMDYSVLTEGQESPKLAVHYLAENAEVTPANTNITVAKYSHNDSDTSVQLDKVYATVTMNDMAEGAVFSVVADGRTLTSLPAAGGSASIVRVPLELAGGNLTVHCQNPGMKVSEAYEVTYEAFAAPTAPLYLTALDSSGAPVAGVVYDIFSGEEKVGTVTSNEAAVLPLGTYTLRAVSVPAGYELPAGELTRIIRIENWRYDVTVTLTGEPEPTDPEPTDPSVPGDLAAAAQAAKEAAEAAQKAAEDAQARAEAAQAAAEAAAASAAEDKTAAEAAQAKAEEAKAQAEAAQKAAQDAQTAAEAAAAAAEASNEAAALEALKAAEDAKKAAENAAAAAESARQAAASQEAAQAAQAAAEKAQAVAEQAQKDAEAAKAAAEEAAQSSADDKDAAEKAAQEAADAQKAAEDAQKAAEDAKAAAEASRAAAEQSNEAAAKSAQAAAESAQEAAEYFQKITEMKADMAQYLEDTQKAKEAAEEAQKAAEKAQLSCSRYYALFALSEYVDEDDYRQTEQVLLTAAIDDGIAAINAAQTVAEIEAALAEAQAVIDDIPTAEEMKMPFTDVKEGDWFEYAVNYVYRNDLFNGVSATEFGPRHSMTRAQMIAVLYRLADQPAVEGTLTFKDVKADAYYAKAVLWGVENDIVNGTTEDTFSPNDPLTRAQAAVMLYRFMDAEPIAEDHLAGFADVKTVPAYAVDALNWAVANGILNGAEDGENLVLAAGRQINRAEVASLLMRLEK